MRIRRAVNLLIVMTGLTTPARAADDTPDPATQREFIGKLTVCDACHGSAGTPQRTNIPILWGQPEKYLLKELHDFQTGNRNVEVMKWMSDSLLPEEQAAAAAVFAKKKWPTHLASVGALPASSAIASCQGCHGSKLLGAKQDNGVMTPRIAGQNYEYLVTEMRRFADGERKNSTDMVQIMKSISPADREATARYLSGL